MLRRGSVIWAILRGPNGELILDDHGKPKRRPALVLSTQAEIDSGDVLRVAAISSKFDRHNLPSNWFHVPSQPGGHPDTGLDQPSVVKADWLARIDQADVISVSRRPVGAATKQVLNWLAQQSPPE